MDRRQIHFLKFILEGYDGMAVLTTLDAEQGFVMLYIAPGCQGVVERVIQSLEAHVRIEPVDEWLKGAERGSA
jgi:hypothetical protein